MPARETFKSLAVVALEVARVDGHRLGPAETDKIEHEKAQYVDVLERVERQPPQIARRGVATAVCHVGVRRLVHGHGQHAARQRQKDDHQRGARVAEKCANIIAHSCFPPAKIRLYYT